MKRHTTEVAEKVARDASPKAAIWICELSKQRDMLREALGDLMADIGGGQKSCGHDFDCICADHKARAALKECE